MQLPLKLALLSIAAIALALGLVAATVQHQTLELAHQERELVETAYLHSKETELRHYVQLATTRSEEHTSELQSQSNLVCRLLLEKKKKTIKIECTPRKSTCDLTWS